MSALSASEAESLLHKFFVAVRTGSIKSMGPGPDVAGGCIGGAAGVIVVTLLCTRVDVRLLVVQGG